MSWLRCAALAGILMIPLAVGDVSFSPSEAFEQRILQEVGARMEQFGQQYISRIEQLQVSSSRTLAQVEEKLGQLQERARVWDTFQSVITSWSDLLIGTDRKMDLLNEGIERTAELYGSISPYSAVAYKVDQLNVKLSRLLTKIPETGGSMVNDFAIKGVMATLRELKTQIEGMNRRRFVIKKVVNTDSPQLAQQNAGAGTADIQYRDIQDELEEAISSNNMLNAIEIKLDRIEAVVTERKPFADARGARRNASVPERHAPRFRPDQPLREPRPRLHGEPRGRRGGGGADGARGGGASCEKLLKQWSQMELNFDQFDAVREAVGRMEDVLDYKTSTVDVKLDRLEDLLFRQGTKLDKGDVSARQNQDTLLTRLQALSEQTAASDTATLATVNNSTAGLVVATADTHSRLERAERLLRNISDVTTALHDRAEEAKTAAENSSRALRTVAETIDNNTAVHFGRIFSALELLAKLHAAPVEPAPGAGPKPSPPPVTQRPPPPPGAGQPGLRGCEDLAELGMSSDVRYRFGDAFGPPVGLDYMERYCDMHTDGGGWTIIQRRDDFGTPKLNFSQPWNAYKHGFGDLDREFWFGNENIHKLTSEQDVTLRVDLADFEGNTAYAVYTKFIVTGEKDGYHLEVAGYHGNASDSLTSHNLSQFSTWDVTNDKAPPCCPCANAYGGGWWFNSCFESNLNGEYHTDPRDNDHYHGIIWELWKGDYSLKSSEMKVRARGYVRDPGRVPTTATSSEVTAPAAVTASTVAPGASDGSATATTATTTVGSTSPSSSSTVEPAVTVESTTEQASTTPDDLGVEPLNA
ncbi:uncharacterized protein LOC119112175 [Pollicipes pollicipes]|uniref:uncharacterized protein LOC119112175 n=1 Tax=Pollicipes pollicipes TaxID=41117 RepID=UPI001884DB8B|nr:uncharacterized protein LOC119112175 [Pollicipes pollicipes]